MTGEAEKAVFTSLEVVRRSYLPVLAPGKLENGVYLTSVVEKAVLPR